MVNSLEEICTKSGPNVLISIKKLIKQGIKPNKNCLINASKLKNNYSIIKYLIHLGIKPDMECLQNQIDIIANKSLSFISDNLEI